MSWNLSLIYVIVMIAGMVIKQVQKQKKEEQRRTQSRSVPPIQADSKADLSPAQQAAELAQWHPRKRVHSRMDSGRMGGNWPSAGAPKKAGDVAPTSSRPRQQRAGASTASPHPQRPQDLREISLDEAWFAQELAKSVSPVTPVREAGVVQPLLEVNVVDAVYAETADAEAYWRRGGKSPEPREIGKAVIPVDEPSILPKRLTPQVLAQGIVLAEVLQPPRAHRPYRPIYLERNK